MCIVICYAEAFAKLKRDGTKTPDAKMLYRHMFSYYVSMQAGKPIERLYNVDQVCSIVLENR